MEDWQICLCVVVAVWSEEGWEVEGRGRRWDWQRQADWLHEKEEEERCKRARSRRFESDRCCVQGGLWRHFLVNLIIQHIEYYYHLIDHLMEFQLSISEPKIKRGDGNYESQNQNNFETTLDTHTHTHNQENRKTAKTLVVWMKWTTCNDQELIMLCLLFYLNSSCC